MSASPLSIQPPPAGRTVDVFAAGESSIDIVGVVAEPPGRNAKARLARLERLAGGQAATAAVTASRLGWRAAWAGALGDDDTARDVEAALAAEGVAVHACRRAGVASRGAVILVDDATGERTVYERRDARLDLNPDECSRLASLAREARVVLVDATDLGAALAVARAAREAGVPVIVDVDRVDPAVEPLLGLVDALVMPRGFAEALTGREGEGAALAEMAARFKPALAVTTLGGDGALALADGTELRCPALAVPVVDTTGAGDAFRGGLAAAWLEGGGRATAEQIVRFANAVAALSCGGRGAQGHLPRRADLAPYL